MLTYNNGLDKSKNIGVFRSMFNVLIMSLCFSDFVSASIGSIHIYCFNGAYFETKFNPRNLCKVCLKLT